MKNLSKEEVRTAEEFFRELFKPDFSTQQTWNSNFKHFNTFDMIQFAESYASQFKSQSEAVGGVIAMYDFLLEENCELREKLKRYEH